MKKKKVIKEIIIGISIDEKGKESIMSCLDFSAIPPMFRHIISTDRADIKTLRLAPSF